MRASIVLAIVCALSLAAGAQIPGSSPSSGPPASPSTAVLVGQTIDGSTGRPVSGVLVALNIAPAGFEDAARGGPIPMDRLASLDITSMLSGVRQAVTDGQGRFAFTGLPAGLVSLTATKPGWMGGGYGQQRPDGTPAPLALTNDTRAGNVVLRVWKNAAIGGTVVDEAGEAIVGLSVRALRRTWLAGHARYASAGAGQTDDRGAYRISGLRPGDYVVVISQTLATTPASAEAGPPDPAMLQNMLSSNGPGTDPNTLMASLGALMGGGFGNGGIRRGEWTLQTSGFGGRLIPPATGSDGRLLAYRTTFYPAASSSSQAATIVLTSGDEQAGVDFQLRPVPVVQVSGTVGGADGPLDNLAIRLIPAGADDLASDSGFESATTQTRADGAFMFLAVPSGQYTLRTVRTPRPTQSAMASGLGAASVAMIQNAQGNRAMSMGPMTMDMIMPAPPPIPAEPTLWATLPISVGDADLNGVNVSLRTGYRVSGRAVFEGSATKPTAEQLRRMPISLERAETGNAVAGFGGLAPGQGGQFDESANFTTYGLVPGKYYARIPVSFSSWTLRSATVGGRDFTDLPIEIDNADISGVVLTFTDRASELSGSVRDAQSRVDVNASVVVFPVQPAAWIDFGSTPRRLRVSKTSGDNGRYQVAGLPPAEYFVAAVAGDVAGDWQNPSYLETLSRTATRVTIGEGERKTMDLTVR